MEIILTQPVRNLGDIDDVVKVKPGYARSYLIPQKLAVLATPSGLRSLEEKEKAGCSRQEHLKGQAQEVADKLADMTIVIETLAGADGKLFSSVTSLMIAKELEEKRLELIAAKSHSRISHNRRICRHAAPPQSGESRYQYRGKSRGKRVTS
ncbi:MAG: 50S ribosomal protein L9 [Bacteroidia bacterium]